MATNQKEERIHIGFSEAMGLILPYAKQKLKEQIKSVFLIVSYLILFQILALHVPIMEASTVAFGIALVIFGLAFFLEGLFLGLMPLGETLGIRLPQKSNLTTILVFSFLLGAGTTLAEPAIGVLKSAGSSVQPWEAPLLYLLLNRFSEYLVYSVGAGVGIAVIFGMLRFLYDWSLKPILMILLSILIPFTLFSYFFPNLESLTGLAWDCGAVTTGPVTVPLVIALGIGISRVSSENDGGITGFGVVTLASLFPVLAVFILGFSIHSSVPNPMSKEEFISLQKDSDKILYLFGGQKEFNQYLIQNSLQPNHETSVTRELNQSQSKIDLKSMLSSSFISSIQAIVPLTAFLLLFLTLIVREKIRNLDEVLLGIFLAFVGMGIFNLGIGIGLGKLGTQVGNKLPAAYRAIEIPESMIQLKNFDPNIVVTSIRPDGIKDQFFYLKEKKSYKTVPYLPENYNLATGIYKYIPIHGPIYGKEEGIWGIIVILLFAFIMGYGATLAEPALNALGVTVEELTVGTLKKRNLIQSVSIGVGVGILLGVCKILFEIPIVYLLIPPYIILVFVTLISSEDFVNIGWDSAGVTTGPITVPLVLALGLGVGGQIGVVEGFGILAMASVCPILSVLIIGLWAERNRKLSIENSEKEPRRSLMSIKQ